MSATALTAAVALGAAGCGLSDDAPRPGVAAEVDGTVIGVDDLTTLVDAVCLSTKAGEGTATSRGAAERGLLQQWIGAEVVAAYAEEYGIDVEAPSSRTSSIPGWDEMSDSEQSAVEDYLDAVGRAQAVMDAAGEEDVPDPDRYDVVINPRFEIAIEDGQFVDAAGQLSVPVSDTALDAASSGELTADQIAALPDSQLCGPRP
ncbi:hypothetical protein [Nocardioides sp. YIM 152588]|uniref:hypothetical protein n=1 Tax=Nocardioides sp. YIM 152588 TaxID=3158259 RepID=UPI0032E4F4C0